MSGKLVAGLLVTVATLVACSREDAPPARTTSPSAAPAMPSVAPAAASMQPMTTGADDGFDARFIDSMIPHHAMAVQMSKDALPNLGHAELRDLAQRIITTQEAEIARMQAWRTEWYGDLPPTGGLPLALSGTADAMGMPATPGARDHAALMAAIKSPGGPSDHAFLDAMIPHHQAAIPMAEQCLTRCRHSEMKTLAQSIIDTQRSEIAQMEAWRQEWFGR